MVRDAGVTGFDGVERDPALAGREAGLKQALLGIRGHHAHLCFGRGAAAIGNRQMSVRPGVRRVEFARIHAPSADQSNAVSRAGPTEVSTCSSPPLPAAGRWTDRSRPRC